jgi:glucosylceramidase
MLRFLVILMAILFLAHPAYAQTVRIWQSSEDGQFSLTPKESLTFAEINDSPAIPIAIDPEIQFQTIVGLGASLEHATCFNLSQLDEKTRIDTLEKIVHPQKGIGMNLMRICIGTSDFTGDPWYTYNDMPENETDFTLSTFSIEKDKTYLLPILKQALQINPDLRFIAAPWSPPAWMKTNRKLMGGQLKPECYEVFAQYLVQFIQAYEAEGIPVYALSPQNEPDYPNRHYPTCQWSGEQQRVFIRDHLGPLFKKEAIQTKILCWDHNWHLLDFPRTILNDPVAAAFVHGTAFHLYEGTVEAQTTLHQEFPDQSIYFTEGSTFRTQGAIEIIDILRNWSQSYNAWVMMLDERRQPNNGPHDASLTPIELRGDLSVRYHFDYYMYGQFMKFIARDAVRIESHESQRNFAHVAFQNPGNEFVVVVANNNRSHKPFHLAWKGKSVIDTLPPKSIGTYVWNE